MFTVPFRCRRPQPGGFPPGPVVVTVGVNCPQSPGCQCGADPRCEVWYQQMVNTTSTPPGSSSETAIACLLIVGVATEIFAQISFTSSIPHSHAPRSIIGINRWVLRFCVPYIVGRPTSSKYPHQRQKRFNMTDLCGMSFNILSCATADFLLLLCAPQQSLSNFRFYSTEKRELLYRLCPLLPLQSLLHSIKLFGTARQQNLYCAP